MKYILLCAILIGSITLEAQSYEVSLSPISIEGLGGLQSYAVGTHNGEWLLVGGRLDGLHRRQPFASFSADGKNQDLIVVNPNTKNVWRAPLATLPSNIREQLSSTNMQFYQSGDHLLCTGGYGYSPTIDDHITYPYLTIIDLAQTVDDVKNGVLNDSSFRQVENESFRVTGGALNRIGDVYHLVGGHKFMGRYNPMGPDHGPGFIQEYTNEIRRFKVDLTTTLSVEYLDADHDAMHLHRRDYNLVPYLLDGERKLMVYSGVFMNTVDFPWLYPVSLSQNSYEALENFTQYYNHYHCANLPIYNSDKEEMHTLFFGGIAQFYEDDGWIVQDNDVPFVNTIADISQDQFGVLKETKLSTTMPGYLGVGSIFILNSETQLIDDDIVDGSTLGEEFKVVGHIYGGIRSSLPNIFWINTGEESEANQTIYEVSIREINKSNSTTNLEEMDDIEFYPNPASKVVRMSIDMDKPVELQVSISDSKGRKIHHEQINKEDTLEGENTFVLNNVNVGYGAFYYTVKIGTKIISRKVIWTE